MRLGFIGAGKMAVAIARGVVGSGLCVPTDLLASARTLASRDKFTADTGAASTTADNLAVAAASEVLFLCVKPPDACAVLRAAAQVLQAGQLVVSVAAGVRLDDLQAAADPETPIIRVMPNTPCLIGKGASVYARGAATNDNHAALVERIFAALGDVHAVPEPLIDAVTGLSGSGPAYIYLVIEALADGGVLMGLPRGLAASLAAQTVLGAAEMVRQTGRHPVELREAVASPGGTTIAALEALERSGVRAAFMGAVRAATERARELGKKG
jgi:pyrroline-5-carboxylate reductase